MPDPICRYCGHLMRPSKVIVQTYTAGMPDFPGDSHGITYSPGGSGRLTGCMKCEACGWSYVGGMTISDELTRERIEGLLAMATPGPWVATFGNLVRIHKCMDRKVVVLAGVHRFGRHGGPTVPGGTDANASLIAAAPDLARQLLAALDRVEALEGALKTASWCLTETEAILGGEYGDHYGPLCEKMLELRNQIAALGGSHE